ncbi:HlyD family efflux transporter periplasmic adaptor subunit [Thiotrichales bacterium 19S9-12]|nr:HlyD family efflux transporter periplasmic adaptor subunit [Thiotrichales bacterium 19S9-11]MCF6811882.1 HlyD family efflux transporter periplasmic adaptor subunit [Thiotrichales bacterium 19S9-12]
MTGAPSLPFMPGTESLLPEILPKLRDDISIEYGGVDYSGGITYIIYDQLNNRFFHLDWESHEILKYWDAVPPQILMDKINRNSLISVDEDMIVKMLSFLSEQCLIEQGYQSIEAIFQRQQKALNVNKFIWLAKNYLFFRLPLTKPNRFLTITYPYVSFIFKKPFFIFMLILALLGIATVSHQWSIFVATFFDMFSLDYLVIFGIAVITAKVFHELGHAYSCKRYGLNVPTMGVAFLVLFPMLYTDTSESWRVKDAKERIRISIAGVQVEVYIAIFALWVWIFHPPGALRSVAFFLCTYSVIATILLNMGPFLRFDGYHILSDILSMRNLQTRAFALSKWWLREKIFGFGIAPPEYFSKFKFFILIFYSWLTWIYRFFLFWGIAFLVYYLFFKSLGIILFILEIIYFIFLPIFKEIKVWWKLRENMKLNRHVMVSLLIVLVLIGLLAIPWRSEIAMPATLSYAEQRVYAPYSGYVKEILIKQGDNVEKGQPMIILKSPQLDFNIAKSKNQVQQIEGQLKVIAGSQEDLNSQGILLSRLAHEKTELEAFSKRKERLVIRAPLNGEVVGILDDIAVDRWVKDKQLLVEIVNSERYIVDAYITEDYKHKLGRGQAGVFVPDNIDLPAVPVKVDRISYQQVKKFRFTDKTETSEDNQINQSIYLPAFHISTLGGNIATRISPKGEYIPESSHYNVLLTLDNSKENKKLILDTVQRGQVFVDVDRESILSYLYKRVIAFFIRESSF